MILFLLKKSPNEYRIVFLGSSITMGWGVPFDSVFSSLLEEQMNKSNDTINYNIINAGIGNYNTVMETIFFKNNMSILLPDQIFLHYFINDAEIINPKKLSFFIKSSHLAAYLYVRLKQIKKTKYNSIGQYYLEMYSHSNPGWADAKESILELNQLCKSNKIIFNVVVQPDLHDLSLTSEQYKIHQIIRGFLNENKIDYIDLFDDFSRLLTNEPEDYWVSEDDPHPNSKGHFLIFKSLYNYLGYLK